MPSTTLIIDADKTDEGIEIVVRFSPDDLEYAGTFTAPISTAIIGRVIVDAIEAEFKRQAA